MSPSEARRVSFASRTASTLDISTLISLERRPWSPEMFTSFLQMIAVLALAGIALLQAASPLGTYSISDDITVSGLSSGGFMAVQVSSLAD